MTRFATASIVAAAALTLTAAAPAATTALTGYVTGVAFPADTRLLGSATNDSSTIDGVHSTVLLTSTDGVDGQEKVAPFFYGSSPGTPIGTLGDLGRGGLTADWRLNNRDSATTASFVGTIAAFRLLVDGPTAGTFAEVIWETNYQSPIPTFVQGTNYDNVDIGGGNFYVRYLGQNYGDGNNGGVNPLTLAQLANGDALTPALLNPTFSDTTNVYGVTVSVGSAAGNYSANVGDINATFNAVPEPASLGLMGVAAAGLLTRRRRRVAA